MLRLLPWAAGALLAVASLGLGSATRSVPRYEVELPGGVPAVVYEPGAWRGVWEAPGLEAPVPVLVLAHGLGGNVGSTSTLARRLARAGYAVVAFDFRGHGRNPRPYDPTSAYARVGLLDDMDAAVLWARMQPHLDGEKVAIAGHSLGASVALEYAANREPGVGAVIAISGTHPLPGTFAPPNALLLWAEHDPDALIALAREAGAALTGFERLVAGRTYGEPARGRAVRMEEIGGTNHLTVLYAAGTARAMVEWLAVAVGPGHRATRQAAGGTDARLVWAGIGLLAALVLLGSLPGVLGARWPRVQVPDARHAGRALGLAALSLLGGSALLWGVDPIASRGPFSFLPVSSGRGPFGLLAFSGGILLTAGILLGEVRSAGMAQSRTWAGAGWLGGFGFVAGAVFASPFWELSLTAERVLPWLAGFALLLPWFGAAEWMLRSPGCRGALFSAAAKGLVLLALLAGAYAGLLPGVILLAVLPLVLLLGVLELVAICVARQEPNPWLAAIVQAAWTAWAFVAVFPRDV